MVYPSFLLWKVHENYIITKMKAHFSCGKAKGNYNQVETLSIEFEWAENDRNILPFKKNILYLHPRLGAGSQLTLGSRPNKAHSSIG